MKLRLQAKYAGVIAGLIILITSVLSAVLMFQFQSSTGDLSQHSAKNMSRELMVQMEKRATTMVHFLSDMLTNPLYQYDIEAIHQVMEVAIGQNDVVNAFVYDQDGRIVQDGHSESARFGEPIGDEESRMAITAAGQLVMQVEGNLLSVSLPIWIGDTPLGGVKLELSLHGINGDIEAMRGDLEALGERRLAYNTWIVVITTSVLILAAIYLGVSVSGRMIKPIRELTENVSRVGRGNYRLRIESKRSDELGDLIDSFNHMTEALDRTTVSKNYVENIIGSMTDMLTVLNADGSIRMVNPAMQALLNFEPDELAGKPFSRLFPEDMRQTAATWLSDLIEKGELRQQEFAFRTRGGEIISVSLSGSVMVGEERLPDSIVCVAQDITERKRNQETLLEAKQKAEEASRTKSDFLAAMSHEIRTPMNGVIGMTDLLLRTRLTERQRRFVGIMHQSAETLLGIINDILDFSRIEAGKLQLDKVSFRLRETVGNMIELLADSAQSKRLELAYFVANDTPDELMGDPNRLRQILINLIGNAIKFTEEGEVVLRITTLRAADGPVELRFEVRDTGIGIEKQASERLFDAFQQVDRSISRRYGGTGLGLSIAKQLVEMMDGEIGFESEPGAGSVFYFNALFDRAAPAADDTRKPHAGLEGIRLLIVDDNATNREILQQYALDWGMIAESAADGPIAIEALRAAYQCGRPFHAAILDMVMPGMNGLELARSIKSDPAIADISLMMLTSVGWQDDTSEMRDAGIATIATKPVRQSTLHNSVMQLLDKRAPDAELERIAPASGNVSTRPADIAGEAVVQTGHRFEARILLVEDNPVNREVAFEHLQALGCQVDTAGNGVEAVSAAEATSFALILMDCQMPVMDGLQATRTIRQREADDGKIRRTPIIALTANAFESDRHACMAAGMDGFLVKPLKLQALIEIFQRWITPGPAEEVVQASGECPAGEKPIEGPDEILDPAALDDIRALQRPGQPDVAAKIARLFLDNSPDLLETLHRSIAEDDLQAVQRAAHTFKSSSANIGAVRLAAGCRALENKCRQGTLEGAVDLLESLERDYQAVAPLLVRATERKAV